MGGPAHCDGERVQGTDNFLPCPIKKDGREYKSVEHFFQCQKCESQDSHDFAKVFASGAGMDSYMAGNSVKIRPDWEKIKVDVMYEANRLKYEQNPDLREHLLATGRRPITQRTSTPFWNTWNALVLTRVREELRAEPERDQALLADIAAQFDAYRATQAMPRAHAAAAAGAPIDLPVRGPGHVDAAASQN